MGEHRHIVCHDCEEFADLQKMHFGVAGQQGIEYFDEEWNEYRLKLLLTFMERHKGCHIATLGEYGRTQHRFFDHNYEEFEL